MSPKDDITDERRERIHAYIAAESKSPVLAFFLALLFGPFGCAYAHPVGSLMYFVGFVVFAFTVWPGAVALWVGCSLFAPYKVSKFNHQIRRGARYVVH
jgi:hypothetical protein